MLLILLPIATDNRLQKDLTQFKWIHLYPPEASRNNRLKHDLLHCTKLDSEQASAECGT